MKIRNYELWIKTKNQKPKIMNGKFINEKLESRICQFGMQNLDFKNYKLWMQKPKTKQFSF